MVGLRADVDVARTHRLRGLKSPPNFLQRRAWPKPLQSSRVPTVLTSAAYLRAYAFRMNCSLG